MSITAWSCHNCGEAIMNSLRHGLKLSSRPCQAGHRCGSGEFCPCPLREMKPDARVPTVKKMPARVLPFKPPFPQMCSCGNIFTDGLPIYCDHCHTFTHTAYWLRRDDVPITSA